jgi:predicted transcriptional regulator
MAQPLPEPTTNPATVEDSTSLAWERARLDEAYDDFATGDFIEGDEAMRWLDNELAEVMSGSETDQG